LTQDLPFRILISPERERGQAGRQAGRQAGKQGMFWSEFMAEINFMRKGRMA